MLKSLNAALGGEHPVQVFFPDLLASLLGRRLPCLLERTLCQAHPADTKCCHCVFYLGVRCVPLRRSYSVTGQKIVL